MSSVVLNDALVSVLNFRRVPWSRKVSRASSVAGLYADIRAPVVAGSWCAPATQGCPFAARGAGLGGLGVKYPRRRGPPPPLEVATHPRRTPSASRAEGVLSAAGVRIPQTLPRAPV